MILVFGYLGSWTIAAWMTTGVLVFINPVNAIVDEVPWTGAHTGVMITVAVMALGILALSIVRTVRQGVRTEVARNPTFSVGVVWARCSRR